MREAIDDVELLTQTSEYSADAHEILDDLGLGCRNVGDQSLICERNGGTRELPLIIDEAIGIRLDAALEPHRVVRGRLQRAIVLQQDLLDKALHEPGQQVGKA